jgi:hypothetical protein
VNSIAIYVEGGGDSQAGRAALRQGLDALLAPQKNNARKLRIRWKTVLCGGRNDAFAAFHHATENKTADVVVLLVDSEERVANSAPEGRVAHLAARDGWIFEEILADRVQLMTQCMEAWIVADPEKLEVFYGQGFRSNSLPKRAVLDEEPKKSLFTALDAATKDSKKGSYGKIKHASKLLEIIRPAMLAKRCKSFRHLIHFLDATIANARVS